MLENIEAAYVNFTFMATLHNHIISYMFLYVINYLVMFRYHHTYWPYYVVLYYAFPFMNLTSLYRMTLELNKLKYNYLLFCFNLLVEQCFPLNDAITATMGNLARGIHPAMHLMLLLHILLTKHVAFSRNAKRFTWNSLHNSFLCFASSTSSQQKHG